MGEDIGQTYNSCTWKFKAFESNYHNKYRQSYYRDILEGSWQREKSEA